MKRQKPVNVREIEKEALLQKFSEGFPGGAADAEDIFSLLTSLERNQSESMQYAFLIALVSVAFGYNLGGTMLLLIAIGCAIGIGLLVYYVRRAMLMKQLRQYSEHQVAGMKILINQMLLH